jgi:hypothetical protein
MNPKVVYRENMTDVCDELKKLENIIQEFIKIWKDNPKVQQDKDYYTSSGETYRVSTYGSVNRAITDIRMLLDKMELFSLYMEQKHKYYTLALTEFKPPNKRQC